MWFRLVFYICVGSNVTTLQRGVMLCSLYGDDALEYVLVCFVTIFFTRVIIRSQTPAVMAFLAYHTNTTKFNIIFIQSHKRVYATLYIAKRV